MEHRRRNGRMVVNWEGVIACFKVKLSLCLIKHCAMKMCGGVKVLVPCIPNLSTRRRFMLKPLYCQGKSLQYPLDWLAGLYNQFGHDGEEKNPLPQPVIISQTTGRKSKMTGLEGNQKL
jgi:hypothetical protein